jgi:hypothetical protein
MSARFCHQVKNAETLVDSGELLKRQLTGLFAIGSPERTIAIYGERLAK